jgi:hypothetical protein
MAPSNPFALLDESEDATPVVKAPEPKVEAAKPGGGKDGAWLAGPWRGARQLCLGAFSDSRAT